MGKFKEQPDEESIISYTASVDERGTLYSLVVSCDACLTPQEYADCLRSFAEDIETGEFDFDGIAENVQAQ